ncbi:MAG: transcription elongation factor GreA [Anaerolineales bacterium]|nr:transcription elongation factor GreA [Anaerolineales bacterium]
MVSEKYLTPEGAAKIKAELKELVEVKRPEIAQRLREAIQMGDLSENADYIMAKEDQAFLEGRIMELQELLSSATIIKDDSHSTTVVGMGSKVTVQEGGSSPEVYTLVGAKEADPRSGRISNESPIGRVILGKRVGDSVKVETPSGAVKLKIVSIE